MHSQCNSVEKGKYNLSRLTGINKTLIPRRFPALTRSSFCLKRSNGYRSERLSRGVGRRDIDDLRKGFRLALGQACRFQVIEQVINRVLL